jgi:hypothetical protein
MRERAHRESNTSKPRAARVFQRGQQPAVRKPSGAPVGELERDHMATLQRLIGNEGVNLLVQREEKKDKQKPKYQGTPDNPFDLLPQITVHVEDLAIGQLKSVLGDTIVLAYNEFSKAIKDVRDELVKQKEEQERRTEAEINFLLGAVIAVVPFEAIGEKIAGDVLLEKTQQAVSSKMATIVAQAAKESHAAAQEAFELTREIESALTADSLAAVAAKFTPELAAEGLKTMSETAGEQGVKLILKGDHPYDIAASFLDALDAAANDSVKKLLAKKEVLPDISQVLAVYHAFDKVKKDYYMPSLRDRAHHFINQLTGDAPGGYSQRYVYINAYGMKRLAKVQSIKETNSFVSWITPDMEQVALAMMGGREPKELSASQIEGHIPDPVKEIPNDFERVVRINAWGKPRLAIVGGDASWFKSYQTEMKFSRWVRSDEEDAQLARASGQIGGLNDVDPSQVKDLKAPTE